MVVPPLPGFVVVGGWVGLVVVGAVLVGVEGLLVTFLRSFSQCLVSDRLESVGVRAPVDQAGTESSSHSASRKCYILLSEFNPL